MTTLESEMREFAYYAGLEVNAALVLPPNHDQSNGNRCDALTHAVMQAMMNREMTFRRELHQDKEGNWHYILAHAAPKEKPTDDDLMTDMNPWQWRDFGGGILHVPRRELMAILASEGAPVSFIALRGVETITEAHDRRVNPYQAG
ncbi:hypothetical protein KBD87_03510 [Candidatus Saccharibacteria bacterium]|nr:hypothetical protein [Candidatus Saccharibacteria bacterium]